MEIRKNPFGEDLNTKQHNMTEQMIALTEYHKTHCSAYGKMLDAMGYDRGKIAHLENLPYIPVTLFKKLRLSSLEEEEDTNYKVITSSGTSGQQTSQIILDGETRQLQQQVLASIGSSFLGEDRLPMLVIDCPATVKKRDHFSARTAGIMGFSLFGRGRTFALRDDMSLDTEAVCEFLEKYGHKPFLLYGFTFIVWKYFIRKLESGRYGRYDFSNGTLIHGGGWKKLTDEAVSKLEFKERIAACSGITRVMDYYGMAEQSGSIFMECECGHLHCSDYSAVITRSAEDFSPCEIGEKGLLQVMSLVPHSYPGHSLLTEDEGTILGVDDCPCGRKGAYFEVHGRVKAAELRGCSDTFQAEEKQKMSGFQWILGDDEKLQAVKKQNALPVFEERTLEFIQAVADRLRYHRDVRQNMPDVMAFAFWCRKGHLLEMQSELADGMKHRVGRGVSLHFAASNIPTLFGYSMVAGLLAGNSCIVRMPRKVMPQEIAIVDALRNTMEEDFPEFAERILLCRYGHDSVINATLSELCDARIIWGSDPSVQAIQKAVLKEDAIDITFGNRYSACVLDAKDVLETRDLDVLVKGFYNDTYLNDQNACSSPRLIYWLGSKDNCEKAEERFWTAVDAFLQKVGYIVPETIAVQKLDALCVLAAELAGRKTSEEGCADVFGKHTTNRITRIQVELLDDFIWERTVSGGCFIEYQAEVLTDLKGMLTESFQTLTYYDENGSIKHALMDGAYENIKRIVPVGHALDFQLVWDGHDLIHELTRENKS